MGRVRSNDPSGKFFLTTYHGHDIVLLAWNLEDATGFCGVRIVKNGKYSLTENLIQRYQWADYGARAGHVTYRVEAHFEGDADDKPRFVLEQRLEIPEAQKMKHAVFFNRGVAGSQGFSKKFGTGSPGEALEEEKRKWLGKELETAMLSFVAQATGKDCELYVCAYELTFQPFLEALKAAINRGVFVRVVYDCKKSGKGVLKSTTADAAVAIEQCHFPSENLIPRTQGSSFISHNKFIVFARAGKKVVNLWTGSTNFTPGGVYGQLNASHWINDEIIAAKYLKCWETLSTDPSVAKTRVAFDALTPLPTLLKPNDVSVVFSPRSNANLLNLQCFLASSARESTFMTAAFGVNDSMKLVYESSLAERFLLLESTRGMSPEFLALEHLQGRISIGSLINDPETAKVLGLKVEELTGLNEHVQFIHTKLLGIDLFSDCPIVVFGSGNFSEASCTKNDENQIISRGDVELADQILCHYFRIFDHFIWRTKVKKTPPQQNFFKSPKAKTWAQSFYKVGSEKARRRNLMCAIVAPLNVATDLPILIADYVKPVKVKKVASFDDRKINLNAESGRYIICFNYDKDLVEQVKKITGRQWDNDAKLWSVPADSLEELRAFATEHKFEMK